MSKYYEREHASGYQRLRAEGKTNWDQLHEPSSFDDFSMRLVLEQALPLLTFPVSQPRTLEYGCGTGPGACFLAARGFRVDGIDISPIAIDMARQFAAERGLDVTYRVADICDLPKTGTCYDLIVDSLCLQCIVTDSDRANVYAAVRSRLNPGGYYLIGTAIFTEDRGYGDSIFDEAMGIVYDRLEDEDTNDEDTNIEGAVELEGGWYLPYRRHLKPHALLSELESAGFDTLAHKESGGGMWLVCRQPAPLMSKGSRIS